MERMEGRAAGGMVESWRRKALEVKRLQRLVLAWAAVALLGVAGLVTTVVPYRVAAAGWARALAAMEARAEVAEAACGPAPSR